LARSFATEVVRVWHPAMTGIFSKMQIYGNSPEREGRLYIISKFHESSEYIGVGIYFVGCIFQYTLQDIYALLMKSCCRI
jgi:hypothetical protein